MTKNRNLKIEVPRSSPRSLRRDESGSASDSDSDPTSTLSSPSSISSPLPSPLSLSEESKISPRPGDSANAKKKVNFLYLSSPEASLSCEAWISSNIDEILSTRRRQVVVFDPFPPEYVDYYKALQEEIANRIPNEQDRPLILLNIKGRNRLNDKERADVGMAGGTGPLSDATALNNLVSHTEVANRMQDFSGVLYSMPPPRDFTHSVDNALTYTTLYKAARKQFPCISLFILTNTGHSNKGVFDSTILGESYHGKVFDLTKVVSNKIQENSSPKENILILGTVAADNAQLYPTLLSQKNLTPVLPRELYKGIEAKLYLQRIINQAKAGKITEMMPGEQVTCGQAFIDFSVHYAQKNKCTSLLFSCTELPMLLHTQIPGEELTYLEKLEQRLNNSSQGRLSYKFYDSEEIFVNEIARNSVMLMNDPDLRAKRTTLVANFRHDVIEGYTNGFSEIKAIIKTQLKLLKTKSDETSVHKSKVLNALLDYFGNGNKAQLDQVILNNPNYTKSYTADENSPANLVRKGLETYEFLEKYQLIKKSREAEEVSPEVKVQPSPRVVIHVTAPVEHESKQPQKQNLASDESAQLISLIEELKSKLPAKSSKMDIFIDIQNIIVGLDSNDKDIKKYFAHVCEIATRKTASLTLFPFQGDDQSKVLVELLKQPQYAMLAKHIKEIPGQNGAINALGIEKWVLSNKQSPADTFNVHR